MKEPDQVGPARTEVARNAPNQVEYERVDEANHERTDVDQNEATTELDDLDRRLIVLLAESPRIGILECSRRLGVARGTAQARLDRLQRRGVIRGFGPDLDLGAIGYGVTAFVTLEIRQGRGAPVAAHLAKIPEVLEVHTTTGQGDLLARIVARSNADLQRVIYDVVGDADIVRTSTTIALSTPIPRRVLPLVRGG